MVPFVNKSTSAKIKNLLTVTIERIKILKSRISIVAKQSREDVAKLLQKGQSDKAIQRVEHVAREENMVAAYELLISYCQIVIARSEYMKAKDSCHPDLREAFATMIYAAPRCGELKELYEIRDILRTRYPNEFSTQVLDHKPEEKVNPQIIRNLSAQPPSLDLRVKLVNQIATDYNINWKYEARLQGPRQNEEELHRGTRNATSDSQRSNPVSRIQDGAKAKSTESDTSRGSEKVTNRNDVNTVQRSQHNSSISAASRHAVQDAATVKNNIPEYTSKDSEKVINRYGTHMVQQSKHETSPMTAPSRYVQGTDTDYTNPKREVKAKNPVSSPDQSTRTSYVDDHTEKTMRTSVHINHSKVEDLQSSTTRSSTKTHRKKTNVDLEAVEAALVAASNAADAATSALEMVRMHSLKKREKMLSRNSSSHSGKSFSSISGNDAVESPTNRGSFQDGKLFSNVSGKDATKSPISRGMIQDDQLSKFSKNSHGAESPLKDRDDKLAPGYEKMRRAAVHNSQIPKFDDYDSDESTARNFPSHHVKDNSRIHRQVFHKSTAHNSFTGKGSISEVSQDDACFENDAESKPHCTKYVANNNRQSEGSNQLSYQRSRTPSKNVKHTEYSEYSEYDQSPNKWGIKQDDVAKLTQKTKSSSNTHIVSYRDEELEVPQKCNYTKDTEGLDRPMIASKNTHRSKADHERSAITRSSRGSNFDYFEAESELKQDLTKPKEYTLTTPSSYHESDPNPASHDRKENYRRPVNRKLQWHSLSSEELDVFNNDDDQPSVTGSAKADYHRPRFDSSPIRTAVRDSYEQNPSAQSVSKYKASASLHQEATMMEPHKLAVKSVRTRAPRKQIDG